VDQVAILQHRLGALDSLLAGAGAVEGGDGTVQDHLRSGWLAERTLIARLLEDTQGPNVSDTVALWRSRTERFLASSGGRVAGWLDARGQRWEAEEVLALLGQIEERLFNWSDPAGKG
jgi:hypothetical protein